MTFPRCGITIPHRRQARRSLCYIWWRCTRRGRPLVIASIERHLPNAEACLTWIDKYGDRDGDGFQEYQTRSTAGYENMAWNYSGDAVMYLDGTLVRGPKALCELQGYVYDAWLRMAEIYDELGNKRRATALRKKAAALFEKFNEDFWDEEFGFATVDWLPDVTLTDLRLGRQRFDIRFWRDGKNTLFKVLGGKRDLVEWKSVALPASRVGG